MDPDAPRAEFGAVENQVVGLGDGDLGTLLHLGDVHRRGEGMVGRGEAPVGHLLEDREVGHPQEPQLVVTLRLTEVTPEVVENPGDDRGAVGHDQEQVARCGGERRTDHGDLGFGEELGDRGPQRPILLGHRPDQALGPRLPGPLDECVEPGSRQALVARIEPAHDPAFCQHPGEGSEFGFGEDLAEVDDLHAETHVGLVGAVGGHGLGVGEAGKWDRDLDALQLSDHRGHHVLERREHVVLIPEGAFQIQLGELDLAIGPEVLVPVAAGDLVVALHAGHHQQLLEELGRLRKGVERPGPKATGHEEVPGALGG